MGLNDNWVVRGWTNELGIAFIDFLKWNLNRNYRFIFYCLPRIQQSITSKNATFLSIYKIRENDLKCHNHMVENLLKNLYMYMSLSMVCRVFHYIFLFCILISENSIAILVYRIKVSYITHDYVLYNIYLLARTERKYHTYSEKQWKMCYLILNIKILKKDILMWYQVWIFYKEFFFNIFLWFLLNQNDLNSDSNQNDLNSEIQCCTIV